MAWKYLEPLRLSEPLKASFQWRRILNRSRIKPESKERS